MNSSRPTRITRRAAMQTLMTQTASLFLLAACGTPVAGAATSGSSGTASSRASATSASAVRTLQSAPAFLSDPAPQAVSASQSALPACVITPQQTLGPYFVDERLNRSDVRADTADGIQKEGASVYLTLQVSQVTAGACTPLAGAAVDLWQCDALGLYSDVTDRSFSTIGRTFLRGYQFTDADGLVQFTTIYPGWYQGRAVHIHFKVRTDPAAAAGYEFVSQLYYDDALTDEVHALPPYAAKGRRTTRNSNDSIYRDGGDRLLLQMSPAEDGYAASFNVGIDLSAPSSGGPMGGPPPGRPR